MKRDFELIRGILLKIEAHPHPVGPVEVAIEGATAEQIAYHLVLLNEAGLIVARDESTFDGVKVVAGRLTWAGHEFLDLARNEVVWRKALREAAKAGVAVSLATLQVLLINAANGLVQSVP